MRRDFDEKSDGTKAQLLNSLSDLKSEILDGDLTKKFDDFEDKISNLNEKVDRDSDSNSKELKRLREDFSLDTGNLKRLIDEEQTNLR